MVIWLLLFNLSILKQFLQFPIGQSPCGTIQAVQPSAHTLNGTNLSPVNNTQTTSAYSRCVTLMGNNNTLYRTKIEKMGLTSKALELKAKGLGSTRIAHALNQLQPDVDINATNVDNFFKSLKNVTQQNKALSAGFRNAVTQSDYKLISKWEKVDSVLSEVLEKTQTLTKKIEDRSENPDDDTIKLLQANLKLVKDIVAESAKISEVRARVLGQITTGTTYYSINIENQFNSLKQLVVDAEGKFPGINAHIQKELIDTTPAKKSDTPVSNNHERNAA